jgi:hypothetical protein
MGNGVVKGKDYVSMIYSSASQTTLTPAQIICRVFDDDKIKSLCYPQCPTSINFNTAESYVSNVAMGVASFGMIGATVAGPVGALVGGLAGTIFGLFKSNDEVEKFNKDCKNIEKYCYVEKSFKCGDISINKT